MEADSAPRLIAEMLRTGSRLLRCVGDVDDLDAKVRERIEELVDEIQSCEYCPENQDPDMGFMLGEPVEIQELLTDAGVDEDNLEDYLYLISCPNCGIGGSDFSPTDEVGMPTAEELLYRQRWNEWQREVRPRVDQFAAELETYPYLGGVHDVGRQILAALPRFERVTLPAGHWWRARKADGARVFSLKDLQPPPPRQAAAEGRFNHFGQAVFYLGGTQRAALRETVDVKAEDRVAWLQEFLIGEIANSGPASQGLERDNRATADCSRTHVRIHQQECSNYGLEARVPRASLHRGLRALFWVPRHHL